MSSDYYGGLFGNLGGPQPQNTLATLAGAQMPQQQPGGLLALIAQQLGQTQPQGYPAGLMQLAGKSGPNWQLRLNNAESDEALEKIRRAMERAGISTSNIRDFDTPILPGK